MKTKLYSLVVSVFISASPMISNIAHAEQIKVVDGDTLEISGIKYRLHGIDTPEPGQKCNKAGGGVWRCGKAATAAMEELVLGKKITCDNRGIDDNGRILSVCENGETELNAWLVSRGFAWAFKTYSLDYVDVEETARVQKIGIWQAPTQTAEEFRKERWQVAEQEAPNGCPIKGNISPNGRIYHAPWSPWYSRTKVSTNKGERWFCNEAEALEAGWRAPYWGR